MVSSGEKKATNNFLKTPLGIATIVIVAIALIYVVVIFSNQRDLISDKDASSNDSLDSGKKAFTEGDFDEAVENLEAATDKDPKSAEAHKFLALSYVAKGKKDKAIVAYEASLDADSDQPDVIYNLAGLLNQGGKLDEATELMETAVKIDDDYMAAKLFLGDLYLKQGKKEKARQQYQEIINRKPNGNVDDQAKVKLEGLGS